MSPTQSQFPSPRRHRHRSVAALQVPLLVVVAAHVCGCPMPGAAWNATMIASVYGACLLWGRPFPIS
jgi:hypothetical protein